MTISTHRIGTIPIAVLVTGALIASSVATVIAQDDETATSEAPPFTMVAGAAVEAPVVTVGDIVIKDGITYTSDFVVTSVVDFDDDRLDGAITIVANMMEGAVEGGDGAFMPSQYRIENEDGAWAGSGIQFWAETDEGFGPLSMETYTLRGEGDYEGMTVQLYSNFLDDGPPSPHGILFEAEAAPMPEPVQPS
jgi:hypothetical protein